MEVCPCNIIGISDNQELIFIPDREKICQKCGQCMAICSKQAITIEGLSYEANMFELPEQTVAYKDLISFLSTRRSIRNFKDTPVPEEMISQILDSLSYAPYGAEPEKVNINVVNNRKVIEEALPHMEKFLDLIIRWMDNPVASYMIKRKKGMETYNTIRNHLYPISKLENYKLRFGDRITRNAPAIIIFHSDKKAEEHTNNSLIYATYTMLTAHSLGLGATMIGIVPAAINKVQILKDIFGIPKGHEAIMSVILGYPKYKYRRVIKREMHPVSWINHAQVSAVPNPGSPKA